MPQQDLYHEQVKTALVKDGWTITADPYVIRYKELRLYADLAAERPLAAEKAGEKIVVEIKVFGSASLVTELERAIGQYALYRTALKRLSPEHTLFLAVPEDVHLDFLSQAAIQDVLMDQAVHLLVFDPEQEVVVLWKE